MNEVPVWFSMLTDGLQTLAALGGAWAVYYGFSAWRAQFRNTEDHSMSRELLKAAYRLRDGISIIRNPMIYVKEVDEAGNRLDELGRFRETVRVYTRRFKIAGKRRSVLETAITEAEALWGEPVREWFMPLIMQHAEVTTGVETHLSFQDPTGIHAGKPLNDENRALRDKCRKSMYSTMGKDDPTDLAIATAMEAIRDKLKTKMVKQ